MATSKAEFEPSKKDPESRREKENEMIPMCQAMLGEIQQEAATTRRVLERIPENKLAWKPHQKSMTIGQLALHMAQVPGGIAKISQADEFDATGHEDQRAENKKATVDRTHLNPKGQALFGRMVADTLVRTQVELGPDVIGESAKSRATVTP